MKLSERFLPSALARIVIKVGSSSIMNDEGLVRLGFLGKLVTTIGRLHKNHVDVILVSSGAIAMGARHLGMSRRPVRITDKQACASVGQSSLMALYEKLFSTLPLNTGQALLTRDDFNDRRRYLNARETLLRLLELNVVPIVNENDSVSVDEIKFGDNDELSALVAGLVDADLLILLTDVEGLYSSDPNTDPNATVISHIDQAVFELVDSVNGKTSSHGSGGMRTKLSAAQICRNSGIPCVIAKSKGSVLEKILNGETEGTYIVPLGTKVDSKRRWLANAAAVHGTLILDDGAAKALTQGGHSLLPRGIAKVSGEFLRGAVVSLTNVKGHEIGRGIVRYGSEDLIRIMGKYGNEIETILGFTFGDEVVHCDDLALTE